MRKPVGIILFVSVFIAGALSFFSCSKIRLPFHKAPALLCSAPAEAAGEKCVVGIASYYGLNPKKEHLNRNTAMNIPFSGRLLEAAMWDVPLGTIVEVTNLRNGKSVLVRVTDRGPAKRLHRVIDLTAYAFSQVSSLRRGLIKVKVRVVSYAGRYARR